MINVVKKIEEKKQSEITSYPVHANYASLMGHPCLRFLVYNRLNWKDKPLPDLERKLVFDEGHHQELQVIKDMMDAGIEIVQLQQPFVWDEYQISGRIDGIIKEGRVKMPIEIKSMSPYSWKAVNSEGDLYTGKWYYRNYLAQMTLYLLMTELEQGLFILKNRSTGQLKQILYPLVYEFGEQLIRKAILVNEYAAKSKYPERMEYRADVCNSCDFFSLCMPPKLKQEAQVSTDTELEAMLNRRGELKLLASEFGKIEREIKMRIGDIGKLICGDWLIKQETRTRKGYEVKGGKIKVLRITNLKTREKEE